MSAEFSTEHIPPGYKRTEVGVIPEDWNVKTMAELFTFQNGVNADKSSYGSGIPFINVLEVITHSTIMENRIPGRVSLSAQTISSFAVQHGDILFNRTSETQEEVGLTSVYIGNELVVFGGFVIRARPKDNSLDSIFTSYVLRSPIVRSQIIARGQGAVRANIGQQDLSRILVVLPTKAEQEAIAEALSDTDALIDSLEQLIAKKHHIKQGAMQELLTGKRRLPGYKVKPSYKQTEIGLIPEDWDIKPLHVLADKIMVGIASAATHAYRDRGIIMFRNQNIKPNYLDDSDILYLAEDYEATFRNKRLRSGDLLTARTGYPGTTSIVPQYYEGSQSFTTLITRPCRDIVDSMYLCYFINSEVGQAYFEQNQIGGGQKNVNAGSLKYLPVLLPSTKAEQTDIATTLSDMDSEITALEEKLTKARQIKQAMMQELLTGRIRLI